MKWASQHSRNILKCYCVIVEEMKVNCFIAFVKGHVRIIKYTNRIASFFAFRWYFRNSILFSLNIVSLYTNIPIDGALKAIKEMFIRYPNLSRTDGVILKLLHIILNNNDFSFNNNVYVQNKGVAMGQRFAPSIANNFLRSWEEKLLLKAIQKPVAFFRYIDDIFCVWSGSLAKLNGFIPVSYTHLTLPTNREV